MLLSACWLVLAARLVSCVVPPLCQKDTRCSLSSREHSLVGEYLYTVAGVPVGVEVFREQFSISLGGLSDPEHLPRYGSLQYYREVHVLGAGRDARIGSILSALNLNTTRLELGGWQGAVLGKDLAAALPGLVALDLNVPPGNTTLAELRWGELTSLRELTASGAVLTGLPPRTLTVLRAVHCQVSALPDSLLKLLSYSSQLPPLPDTVISLHVTNLPPPAGRLPSSLVNLTLEHLPSTSLPTSLPGTLSSLLVSRCSLVSVPSTWTSLQQLRRLRLNRNLLRACPTREASLPALLELDLSYNKLTSLHPGDLPLPSLTDLQLSYNLLQTLSSEVLAECPKLERLRVVNNRLTVLDAGGMPHGLRLVDAKKNLFTELTDRELAGRPGLVLDYEGNPVTGLRGGGNWAELRLRDALLHCGAELLKWTERAGPALSRVTAVCSSPPALVGRALRDAPRDLYQDDVPEGCPAACTCVLRPGTPRGPTLLLTCNATRAGPHLATYRAPSAATTLNLVLEGDFPPALSLPEGVMRLELRGAELTGFPPLPAGLRELDVRGARAARKAEPAAGLGEVQALLVCDCDMLRLVGGARELQCGGEDAGDARDRCGLGEVRGSLLSGWLAGAAVLVSVLSVAVCWTVGRHYRRPTGSPSSGDLQYDAFVSFAHEDRTWVCRTLVPRLEEGGARLCLHSRDWLPGGFVPAQIDRSVRSARVTLLVASPHFARSTWAGAELTAALQGGAAILVLLPDAPLSALLRAHPPLARRTHLHCDDPHFWYKLQRAILPARPARPSLVPAKLTRLLCCPARTPVTADDVSYKKGPHVVT